MIAHIVPSVVITSLLLTPFITHAEPELLFKSKFEGPIIEAYTSPFKHFSIFNTDIVTGYDWMTDIDSIEHVKCASGFGCMYGNYGYNTFGVDAIAEITSDPDDPVNHVFHFQHNAAPDGTARLALSLIFNRPSDNATLFNKGYSKYRMRLSDGFKEIENISNTVDWLNITEWWEYLGDTGTQNSRVSLDIHKTWGVGEKIYWHLAMQDYLPIKKTIWSVENKAVDVPTGVWFTIETYFVFGDEKNGRVWVAITRDNEPRQVIFDINNFTQNTVNPSVMSSWHILKLYTTQWLSQMMSDKGTPLGIYYDDFEYWSEIPYALGAPMPPSEIIAD